MYLWILTNVFVKISKWFCLNWWLKRPSGGTAGHNKLPLTLRALWSPRQGTLSYSALYSVCYSNIISSKKKHLFVKIYLKIVTIWCTFLLPKGLQNYTKFVTSLTFPPILFEVLLVPLTKKITRLFTALRSAWPQCTWGPSACGALRKKLLSYGRTDTLPRPPF